MSALNKLFDSPHLLDILIEVENMLDTMDIYLYDHWFSGLVLDGPKIKKYFIEVTLQYSCLPDPKAAKRLLKHGILCVFTQSSHDKKLSKNNIWNVNISIPKHLFQNLALSKFQDYEDEIDVQDVQDAIDTGLEGNNV